jgi:hypothetical protein
MLLWLLLTTAIAISAACHLPMYRISRFWILDFGARCSGGARCTVCPSRHLGVSLPPKQRDYPSYRSHRLSGRQWVASSNTYKGVHMFFEVTFLHTREYICISKLHFYIQRSTYVFPSYISTYEGVHIYFQSYISTYKGVHTFFQVTILHTKEFIRLSISKTISGVSLPPKQKMYLLSVVSIPASVYLFQRFSL